MGRLWQKCTGRFDCLLSFCVLATFKDIRICDNVQYHVTYSASRLWCQTTSTMTAYPTQPHYPDTELTSTCPILMMLSTWLGSDKSKSLSHWFHSTRFSNPWGSDCPISQSGETDTLLIWPGDLKLCIIWMLGTASLGELLSACGFVSWMNGMKVNHTGGCLPCVQTLTVQITYKIYTFRYLALQWH